MGSGAQLPYDEDSIERDGVALGDLLSGRLSDAELDSVEAVREERAGE